MDAQGWDVPRLERAGRELVAQVTKVLGSPVRGPLVGGPDVWKVEQLEDAVFGEVRAVVVVRPAVLSGEEASPALIEVFLEEFLRPFRLRPQADEGEDGVWDVSVVSDGLASGFTPEELLESESSWFVPAGLECRTWNPDRGEALWFLNSLWGTRVGTLEEVARIFRVIRRGVWSLT